LKTANTRRLTFSENTLFDEQTQLPDSTSGRRS
jgi:hypothetical protein